MNIIDTEGICQQITGLFQRKLYLDVTSPDADLLQAGVLDSALIVEILLMLEQEFDVYVPIESLELESVRTIRNISKLIAAHSVSAN